jgi:hypothetical protein
MSFVMTKCCHQCQMGRLSYNWFRLMESWFGLLVVIDLNPWRVILLIDVNPWRSLVANYGSAKVWVRDLIFF